MINFQSKRTQLAIGCVLSVLLAGYFVFFHRKPVAQVGDWKIYREDADYRDRIILLDFPNETRSMGLFQLMKSAINLAILKNNGVSIQKAQIEQEEKRINQSTKNPEQLAKIKEIFGKNIEAYRRDFVLPALVDRMIYYDFFLTNENVQFASLLATTDFIREAGRDPAKFKKLAAARNLEVHKVILSLKKGLIWSQSNDSRMRPKKEEPIAAPVQSSQENQELYDRIKADMNKKSGDGSYDEEAKKWYELVVRPMKVGEVTVAPISREEAWLVAKLTKKISDENFELEVVTFPKLNFGTWYEAEKAKVKVEVTDKNYPVP